MEYKIQKKYYENFIDIQRDKLLGDFKLDDNGDIVIRTKKRGYSINGGRQQIQNDVAAISMFSGAGGLDIGAYLAGINILSSLDIFEDSVATLKMNKCFNNVDHQIGDITSLDLKYYSGILKKNKSSKLVIIGGPPCQPFSKAGYWVTNKKRNPENDPRNLLLPYFDAIGCIQPDGFVLENVESILHPSNKIAIDTIDNCMNKLGYNYSMLKLNAVEYGIPQKRKRVFFLASKKKINACIMKTNGSTSERNVNPNLLPYERVVDWIAKFDTEKYYVDEKTDIVGKWENELCLIPFGKNYIALSEKEGFPTPVFVAGKRYWTSLLKLHPLLPSWTIIASPGHWEGPFHWTNRRLSIKELAAIQTFPDDYVFYGSQISKHKQIGNAVPPLLGKLVIEELCKWL